MNAKILCASVCFALAAPVASAQTYAVTQVPGISTGGAQGQAVNDKGEVAGYSLIPAGRHGFLWSKRKVQDLGTLKSAPDDVVCRGGYCTVALGVNNSSDVVGWAVFGDSAVHAVVWQKGRIQDLDGRRTSGVSVANGISNNGSVVGAAGGRAVIWRKGNVQGLPAISELGPSSAYAINEAGDIAGCSAVDNDAVLPAHPVMWVDSVLHDLGALGIGTACATAINDRRQVAGYWVTSDGHSGAFVWQNGYVPLVPLPGDTNATALAISNAGDIVGASWRNSNQLHPVIWHNGQAIDLDDRIPEEFRPLNGFPTAVNNRGQIVVVTSIPGDISSGKTFVLTPQ